MPRIAHGLWAACIAALMLLPGGALAQDHDRGERDQDGSHAPRGRWSRSGDQEHQGWADHRYEIDRRTAKKLTAARDLTLNEKYDEAEERLDSLRMNSLNPLERAQTYRLRAYIAYGREDLAAARDFLEKTIAEGVLPPSDVASIRFQIAQLWFSEENWAEGARNLEKWFTIEPDPPPSAHYLLALAYYQLDDYDKALPLAQQAVDGSDEPQESWLQLLLALRLTRQQYREAVPILDELVERYPKKSYWLSLSTVHGALGEYEEALIPLQFANAEGLLTSDEELRRLAQLLLYLDLPYRAARVLQQGLDSGLVEDDAPAWEMLGNSLISAREFEQAAGPLERAAQLAPDGSLYVRLAQVHMQRERWEAAAEALRHGLDKGLEKPGQALLLMGIALHSQKHPEQARSWFARASQHDDASAEARSWLQYIDRELASG